MAARVTGAVASGGLGFGFKWDMGWMHDVLQYQGREPVHRRFHHDEITFRSMYAFSERYVLPLSHDEVVHGKGSLLGKMPGDEWQRFANLRLLYGTMWGQPGKKLLFMGGELATLAEWAHEGMLDWASTTPPTTRACAASSPTSTPSTGARRRSIAATASPPGSATSSATTTRTACSPGSASTRRARHRRCSSSSTPRRRCTTATGSVCPKPAKWTEILNTDATDLRRQRRRQPRTGGDRGAALARLPSPSRSPSPARGRLPPPNNPQPREVPCIRDGDPADPD